MINDYTRYSSIRRTQPAMIILDCLILPISVWVAFALRYGDWLPAEILNYWWLFIVSPLVAMPVFITNGLYRAVLIYISFNAFVTIVKAVSLHVLALFLIALVAGFTKVSPTVFAIYWLVVLTFVGGSRAMLRAALQWYAKSKNATTEVAIYGAGDAGAELAEALQAGFEFSPIAFIDDKHELQGAEIRGLKVYPTSELGSLVKNCGVRQILLAIPTARRSRRKEIVDYLKTLPVHVRTVPSLMDIVSGRYKVADIREVGIEDILGREPVPPDNHLLSSCIAGKSVMVTGAGGSIGSELCRQIIGLKPRRIVLFDASEYALYCIEQELRQICMDDKDIELDESDIIPVLGTITNQHKVEYVLKIHRVHTLYHAAAYKHVPLVEYNPIEGVRNNVFGTYYTAQAALGANIDTFILISTDKAVRPTNVMGATKRMSELVVQGLGKQRDGTRFSIVRFGNVLGSSGSVVNLFRKQIQSGGPVTLTHPDIMRYFMTIPEAAQLVIQAGSMGQGGEVFVLDMGEPVRIQDLARHMISLSGLTVCDEHNPDGDVSIEITQLRPGEKLYEELLIGNNVTGTEHPQIMRAKEDELPWDELLAVLNQLDAICRSDDTAVLLKFLERVIDGYSAQCDLKDPVWIATHQEDKVIMH